MHMCPRNLQAQLHLESVFANGTKLGTFRVLSIYTATQGGKGHQQPAQPNWQAPAHRSKAERMEF